jgi:hypothetical protein
MIMKCSALVLITSQADPDRQPEVAKSHEHGNLKVMRDSKRTYVEKTGKDRESTVSAGS